MRNRHCMETTPSCRWKPAVNVVRLRREEKLVFERWYPESEH